MFPKFKGMTKKPVKHPELQRIEKGALNYTRRTYLWLHPPNHSKVGAPWSTIRQHKPTAHSKNQHGRPPKLVSKCCKAAGTRNGTIETYSSEMLTISLQLHIMLSEYYKNTQLPFTIGPLLQTAGNCKPKHTPWHQEVAKARCNLIEKSRLLPKHYS